MSLLFELVLFHIAVPNTVSLSGDRPVFGAVLLWNTQTTSPTTTTNGTDGQTAPGEAGSGVGIGVGLGVVGALAIALAIGGFIYFKRLKREKPTSNHGAAHEDPPTEATYGTLNRQDSQAGNYAVLVVSDNASVKSPVSRTESTDNSDYYNVVTPDYVDVY